VLRLPFSVTNRHGIPLVRAELAVSAIGPDGPVGPLFRATTDERGVGELYAGLSAPTGTINLACRIRWTDEDGVVWGFESGLSSPVLPPIEGRGGQEIPVQGYIVTTRLQIQAPLPPEITANVRGRIGALRDGRHLLHAYSEARDALIGGFPNSSAVMAGKVIETAIILRGRKLGWPTDEWEKGRFTLGDYLRESAVEQDISKTFSPGFFKLLSGTNVARILGAHQKFERIDMDNARAVLGGVTKLLDGWFERE
jgi:hypothetical protein